MSTRVWYQPDGSPGAEVDLARLPEAMYTEIASLRGHLGRDDRVLTCMGNGKPMYVYRNAHGRYFARHFPGDSSDGHVHPISKMSDEHRRQVDYLARAASTDGLEAIPEFSTGYGTRLDLAVRGDLAVGFEVQRSGLSRASAQRRTALSHKAGFTVAWTHDHEDGDPGWAYYVPTARLIRQGAAWDRRTPPPGTAKAIIRDFERVRNGLKWEYKPLPKVVILDDLPAKMTAGEIVAVATGRKPYQKVHLAYRSAAAVIESATYAGASAWTPSMETPERRDAPQRHTTECHQGSGSPTAKTEPVNGLRSDREFDAWIRSQPGRCRSCGYHPQTQGHHEACPARRADS